MIGLVLNCMPFKPCMSLQYCIGMTYKWLDNYQYCVWDTTQYAHASTALPLHNQRLGYARSTTNQNKKAQFTTTEKQILSHCRTHNNSFRNTARCRSSCWMWQTVTFNELLLFQQCVHKYQRSDNMRALLQ